MIEKLPTWEECNQECNGRGYPTDLMRFIYNNEPSDGEDEDLFRKHLLAALNEQGGQQWEL
jgi:hypothetical protein